MLCRVDEIEPDLGTARFTWFEWDGPERVVIIRRHGDLYAYINRCPHALAHLDHPPGDFFSLDRRHIQCSFHGARFRIDDGHCIAGPCKGCSLSRRQRPGWDDVASRGGSRPQRRRGSGADAAPHGGKRTA